MAFRYWVRSCLAYPAILSLRQPKCSRSSHWLPMPPRWRRLLQSRLSEFYPRYFFSCYIRFKSCTYESVVKSVIFIPTDFRPGLRPNRLRLPSRNRRRSFLLHRLPCSPMLPGRRSQSSARHAWRRCPALRCWKAGN